MENNEKLCDFQYLSETMGGNKEVISEIINAFIDEIPQQLQSINDAITKTDYSTIKKLAHHMKSSVSILGISKILPILKEIENFGANATNIEKIKELYQNLDEMCNLALKEIEQEKSNYI